MNLILIKILISTRVNPVLGGILSGLPLGAGLSVFLSYDRKIF